METPCAQTPDHETGKGKWWGEKGDTKERRKRRSEETGKVGRVKRGDREK